MTWTISFESINVNVNRLKWSYLNHLFVTNIWTSWWAHYFSIEFNTDVQYSACVTCTSYHSPWYHEDIVPAKYSYKTQTWFSFYPYFVSFLSLVVFEFDVYLYSKERKSKSPMLWSQRTQQNRWSQKKVEEPILLQCFRAFSVSLTQMFHTHTLCVFFFRLRNGYLNAL